MIKKIRKNSEGIPGPLTTKGIVKTLKLTNLLVNTKITQIRNASPKAEVTNTKEENAFITIKSEISKTAMTTTERINITLKTEIQTGEITIIKIMIPTKNKDKNKCM